MSFHVSSSGDERTQNYGDKNMKKILLASAVLGITSAAPLAAQAQDYSISASIDYVTEYVFRGVSLEDEAIQPGVEVAVGDFAVGAWASAGFGSDSQADTDELDLYAGYSFGLTDLISGSVGVTNYIYPDSQDTFEFSLGGALDTVLAPSLTAYYDVTLESFTLEGGVGHSFPLADKTSFDLGITAGLVDVSGGNYEYASASASLGYGFADNFSGYVGANYVINSEDSLDFDGPTADDNLLWFGVGVASGF